MTYGLKFNQGMYVFVLDLTESKQKSVRFSSDAGTTDDNTSIYIDRLRDISIFTGFTILRTVMNVIYFCSDHQYLSPTVSFSGQETLNAVTHDHCSTFQTEYDQNVNLKLKECRTKLSNLQPLTFRVEILENILSLMFVSHEHFQESFWTTESDSELDVDYDSSRNTTMDEQSIISEESCSPTTEPKDIFSNQTFELSQSGAGSYDEPFIESKTSGRRKISTSRSTSREDGVGKINSEKGSGEKPSNKMFYRLKSSENELKEHKESLEMVQKQLERIRRNSGTGSTTQSYDSLFMKFGFLCNEYLVRDLLHFLKECLLDLSAARYKVLGGDSGRDKSTNKAMNKGVDVTIEEPLSKFLQSSVNKETLQNRIAHLTQCVHQAQWRFQLVSNDCVPKEVGKVLSHPIKIGHSLKEEELQIGLSITKSTDKLTRQKPKQGT